MTIDELVQFLGDDNSRALSPEMQGEQAIEFLDLMNSLDGQPQILPEHEELIRKHKHIVWTQRDDVENRWIPRWGDIAIGSFRGRTALIVREDRQRDNILDGKCLDCMQDIVSPGWPFRCYGKGHTLYIRLAFLGKGRTREFAPPMPLNPIDGPQITRDWMNADGTTRPMDKDEWNKNFVGHDA